MDERDKRGLFPCSQLGPYHIYMSHLLMCSLLVQFPLVKVLLKSAYNGLNSTVEYSFKSMDDSYPGPCL